MQKASKIFTPEKKKEKIDYDIRYGLRFLPLINKCCGLNTPISFFSNPTLRVHKFVHVCTRTHKIYLYALVVFNI